MTIYNQKVKAVQIQIMDHFQQNDEHLMNKLQQIVPQLRKQMQTSIRSRLAMDLERAKLKKRQEVNQLYQQKLKSQIENRNQHIKHSLSNMVHQIQQLKKNLSNTRPKKLSIEEQDELVELTVEQMMEDESMLDEIKSRIRPRLEMRVRAALQKELEGGVEQIKRELQQRMAEEKDEWVQERVQHWKAQSQSQLAQLAAQHSQLNSRKQSMENTLNLKRMQKKQAEQRLESINQKNALIANLRAQLKQLRMR